MVKKPEVFERDMNRVTGRKEKWHSECFYDAIAYYWVRSCVRKKLEAFKDEFINKCVSTPVEVSQISKFVKGNPLLRARIQVLYLENNELFPLYVSSNTDYKRIITLLLYGMLDPKARGDDKFGGYRTHYALVVDVNKFLQRSYINKKGQARKIRNQYWCLRCLNRFHTTYFLALHEKTCQGYAPQKVVLPNPHTFIKFGEPEKRFPPLFIGYFDFEALSKPNFAPCEKCVDYCSCNTKIERVQSVITYSLIILDGETDEIVHESTVSHETDAIRLFLEELLQLEPILLEMSQRFRECPKLTEEEENRFHSARRCHICCKKFASDDKNICRDHCHRSGKFLGAAHQCCNLRRREEKKIVLFAHNFSGYDSHFIVRELNSVEGITIIKCLPKNQQKFRTLQINSFHMCDR